MKKVTLLISISILSTALVAMDAEDKGSRSPYGSKSASPIPQQSPSHLRHSAEQEKEIVLVTTLQGSLEQQQKAVRGFIDQLPHAIANEDSRYEVDVPALRTLLVDTYSQFPKQEGTISPLLERHLIGHEVKSSPVTRVKVAIEGDGDVEVRASSPRQKRAAAVQEQAGHGRPGGNHDKVLQPDLAKQVEQQVIKLEGIFLGNRRYAKFGLYSISLVVGGMIIGWFYTTKAHHAAAHHGGN